MRCCAGDEGVVALRRRPAGAGVNPPQAALAEDCCGERWGKGAQDASGGDQEGERERTAVEVPKDLADIRTGATEWSRDKPGGRPVYWPGGVRYAGGAILVCGFCTERGKACAVTGCCPRMREGAERKSGGGGNR